MNRPNLHRTASAAAVITVLLALAGWALAQRPPALSPAPAPSRPAAPVLKGMDALTDDAVMSELSERGLQTLLKHAFVVNRVSEADQASFTAQKALRDLLAMPANTSPARIVDLVRKACDPAALARALPTMRDPDQLMRLATMLITYGAEPDLNVLEYWGEDNPKVKAQLRPVAEGLLKVLERSEAEYQRKAEILANRLGANPTRAQEQEFEKAEAAALGAKFARVMSSYYLALALDKADAQRSTIANKAIREMGEWDNADSTVQPTVRTRMAKLHATLGEHERAKELFDSVAGGKVKPEATIVQQYEPRYFSVVCDLQMGKLAQAAQGVKDLEAWEEGTLAKEFKDAGAMDSIRAARSMLHYRLFLAEEKAAKDDVARNAARQKAVAVLLDMVNKQPRVRAVVFQQLMNVLPANPDLKTAHPLVLEALIHKGQEQTGILEAAARDAGGLEKFIDPTAEQKQVLQVGIAATRELLTRQGVAKEAQDRAAFLLGAMCFRIGRKAEAADAYLDYITQHGANREWTATALAWAKLCQDQVRQANPNDPEAVRIFDRILPIAIGKFGEKNLGFPWAERLRRQAEAAMDKAEKTADPAAKAKLMAQHQELRLAAISFYKQVEKEHPRYADARYYEMLCQKELLDRQADPAAKAKLLAEVRSLLALVDQATETAMKSAPEGERLRYRSLHVRSRLLAADLAAREEKSFARVIELLEGFEEDAEGLPNKDDLVSEVLFLRYNAQLETGKIAAAAETLLKAIEKDPQRGLPLVFGMLRQLDKELDNARRGGQAERTARLTQARAGLTPKLVDWARGHKDPKVRVASYRYGVFDAESKRLAALLIEDEAARAQALAAALAAYKAMEAPDQRKLHVEMNKDKPGFDAEYPDPAVRLGIGLIHFDQKDYRQARDVLGQLLTDRKLGNPTYTVEEDGQVKTLDNEFYWEARYKLPYCNVQLAKANPGDRELQAALEATKTDLKGLMIRFDGEPGGKKWNADFKKLAAEIIPGFDHRTLVPSSQPVRPATSPVASP